MTNKIFIYKVQAKRKNSKRWSAWVTTRDYDQALIQAKRVERLGYDSRIVEELYDENLFNSQVNLEEEDEDDVEAF